MQNSRFFWPDWARFLQQRGLGGIAAQLIDTIGAASPLAILGAQAIYFGQPLVQRALPDGQIQALAQLLEDQSELHNFAAFLREERLP